MRPRHLEVFYAVAAYGSVTEAARRLHVSQPAVSKYLQELHEELGFPLRRREGNMWTLTPEGRLLFEEIGKSFVAFDRLSQYAVDLKTMRVGRLTVACLPLLSVHPLSQLVEGFLTAHSDISLTLLALNSQGVVDHVISGRADVGIGLHVPMHAEVASRLIAKLRLVCMIDRSDPLCHKDVITAADLHERRIITLGTGDSVQFEIDQMLRQNGVRPARRITSLMSRSVLELAELGLGIALLDDFVATQYDGERLVRRSFSPETDYAISIVTSRMRPPSRLADAFASYVGDHFRLGR
ncbi:DNA-binding transcriptional LysR family regulator [Rhodoligotrophos appendicifer]|uniref:LysR family transcriptional regulator n=1 Tax=Rhodoligotrophos appendicifer TaxID=987056 RepID=UPI00147847E1|nr:LysR substrate-binding domain-containing protein [Rhodoligotrophos appendicifer]